MREVSKIVNGKRIIYKKPELLAPAGNLEKLKVAIRYGADAVFVGGKEFSLRSGASNFTLEDIKEAVEFANKYNAAIHVTCNIILHQDNLQGIEEYLSELDKIGVRAIIVADPYIMMIAKKLNLKLEVHVSTQLSTLNSKAIKFYENQGMDRVVLGREVCYDDLKMILDKTDMDIEYFIHGAMCIHYSGRCMLSNYFSHRDANRGGCSQSCRWYYDIYDEHGKLNEGKIPFSMSSKDMALINHIPELIIAIDISASMTDYCNDPDNFVLSNKYYDELLKAANRALCTGFFDNQADNSKQLYNQRDEHPTQEFCARVVDYDKTNKLAIIEQRNYFSVGDKIEFFSPNHDNIIIKVEKIINEDNENVLVANHPMEILKIPVKIELEKDDMGRKVN